MGVEKITRPVLGQGGFAHAIESTSVASGSTLSANSGYHALASTSTSAVWTLPAPERGVTLKVAYDYGTTGSTGHIRTHSTGTVFSPSTANTITLSSGQGVIELIGLSSAAWGLPQVGAVSGTVALAAST